MLTPKMERVSSVPKVAKESGRDDMGALTGAVHCELIRRFASHAFYPPCDTVTDSLASVGWKIKSQGVMPYGSH